MFCHLLLHNQKLGQDMTYSPAERVTCPHVNHNISGRQIKTHSSRSRPTYLKRKHMESCNMASLQFSKKKFISYIDCMYRFLKKNLLHAIFSQNNVDLNSEIKL